MTPDADGYDESPDLDTEADADDEYDYLPDPEDVALEGDWEVGTVEEVFLGDDGQLSLAERKTLAALLKKRYISAEKNPVEWRVLIDDPRIIKVRLNELFLDLQVDRVHQVAFKRQATAEPGTREFPTLLHDRAYSREETILLALVRHRLQSDRADGQSDVTVEREELCTHVQSFRPPNASDFEGDKAKVNRAIDSLVKAGVLLKTNDPDRLRVAAALPVLLPLERLQTLWDWLIQTNGTARPDTTENELAVVDDLEVQV